MKKTSIVQISSAIALVAATLVAPNTAFAQSGSRLCGWTADLKSSTGAVIGKIGMLYEARTKDSSYTRQCNEAKSKMKDGIDSKEETKSLTWTEINKKTCEEVGAAFTSTDHTNGDMCDYMDAKQPYKVTKKPNSENITTTTTIYEKM